MLGVVGKVSGHASSREPSSGCDLHTDLMSPEETGTTWENFLDRIKYHDELSLPTISEFAGLGEVPVDPHGQICAAEAVLHSLDAGSNLCQIESCAVPSEQQGTEKGRA